MDNIQVPIKKNQYDLNTHRGQELCESGGGRPGLPVPNKPRGFCGREATLTQTNTG